MAVSRKLRREVSMQLDEGARAKAKEVCVSYYGSVSWEWVLRGTRGENVSVQ